MNPRPPVEDVGGITKQGYWDWSDLPMYLLVIALVYGVGIALWLAAGLPIKGWT